MQNASFVATNRAASTTDKIRARGASRFLSDRSVDRSPTPVAAKKIAPSILTTGISIIPKSTDQNVEQLFERLLDVEENLPIEPNFPKFLLAWAREFKQFEELSLQDQKALLLHNYTSLALIFDEEAGNEVISTRLKQMELNKIERVLLKGILLFTSEGVELEAKPAIRKLPEALVHVLADKLRDRKDGRLAKILLFLPSLLNLEISESGRSGIEALFQPSKPTPKMWSISGILPE
ncbi:unnamed protein product, partial [Mesorhabditis spiculigera]